MFRRLPSLALVLVLAAGTAVIGLASAAPASAAPICPPGSYATGAADLNPGVLACQGYDGVRKGGIVNGGYVKTIPGLAATIAPPLTQPGSTLSAAAGGPPTNNANSAAVNGNPNNPVPGKLSLGTRALQNGTAILGAGAMGYSMGNQLAQMGCSFGLDDLCTPQRDTSLQPNQDITSTVAPGWKNGQTFTYDLGTTPPTMGKIQFTTGFANGATPPTFGQRTYTYGQIASLLAVNATWTGCGDYRNPCYSPVSSVRVLCKAYRDSGGTDPYANQSINNLSIAMINNGQQPATFYFASTGGGFGQGSGTAGGQYVMQYPSLANQPVCGTQGGFAGIDFVGGAVTSKITPLPIAHGDGSSSMQAWFPEGSQYFVPGTSANPDRRIRTTNDCVKPDGTVINTTATSGTFKETDSTFPAIPAAAPCPTGTILGGTHVEELGDGVGTKKIADVKVPQKIIDNQQAYPECLGGECRLRLIRIGPADADLGDCFAKVGRCSGWFKDPAKADNYQCTYGKAGAPHVLALAECNVYAPTFDRAADPTKAPYGDPDTGAEPGAGTGNGNPDPTTDPTPAGDFGGADCFPSGWGAFNPVNWILQPIKCALIWAFVPPADTMTDLGHSITGGGTGTGVSAWFSAYNGLFTPIAGTGNSSCDGLPVDVDQGPIQIHFVLLNSCSEPMKTAAAISYAFTSFIVVIMGGLAAMRGVTQPFGFDVTIGQHTKHISR